MGKILDQCRMTIVNTNLCNDIYIEKKTCSIRAAFNGNDKEGFPKIITLGTYQTVEECKRVLSVIFGVDDVIMPPSGSVNDWFSNYQYIVDLSQELHA